MPDCLNFPPDLQTRNAPTSALIVREASITPRSINETARTVEVTWSTGAAVRRRDLSGEFVEVLSMDPAHVNMERLRGAPVLDAHQRTGVRQVLGTVLDASVDGKEGRATLQFSSRPDVAPIWDDVRAGILRHVSVGYTVEHWKPGTDTSGLRTLTATAWTPYEVSLVPVPADPGAQVRSTPEPEAHSRAAVNGEIRQIARLAGLGDGFANTQIDRNATPEQARAAAFAAMQERSGGPLHTQRVEIGFSNDDPAIRAERIGEALFTRAAPGHRPSEAARPYIGLSIPEIGRDILRARGMATTGLSAATVITRALTTSDFALILGDAANRILRQAYQAAPIGIKQLARQASAKDFRAKMSLMLSEAPTLKKVSEDGEFTHGSLAEAGESYRLETFGRIVSISRQALVNDDLGAFTTLNTRFGVAAAEFEAMHLLALLESNSGAGPTMADTVALFHASHGNLAASGAAPSETTLNAARLAMRKQTGLAGGRISVAPRYILVPAELETATSKLVATITPTTVGDVNAFAGQLTPIVEARLASATRWYLAADPAQMDGLEYAYLDGEPGPQIESRTGFEVDGVQVKVRMDFGAGFIEHRGWYANTGA
jgi:phage head maturation protease